MRNEGRYWIIPVGGVGVEEGAGAVSHTSLG